MTIKPQNAIAYCRISDARDEDTAGVDRQEQDARQLAERLGWTISRVIVENSVSAFKRRKVTLPDGNTAMRVDRPGWREMLAELTSGRADGLIAYDLDRAARDPRDLEDLIDAVEASRPRLPVESVTGSLRLANDSDVTMARVMVAVANKSSRDASRRIARAAEERAKKGGFSGGKRPFGFEPDGVTVRESEAEEIRRWADAVIAGVSLRQICADLREREIPTANGGAWWPRVVKGVLTNPRIAGIAVYQGAEVGPASWEPIVPEETLRALQRTLTDPARGAFAGRTPKYIGSGIFRCGKCGGKMIVRRKAARHENATYRCRDKQHLTRSQPRVDAIVEAVIIERLSRPDAVDLLARDAEDDVDTAALHAEAVTLRQKRDQLAEDFVAELISRAAMQAGIAVAERRLGEIEDLMAKAAKANPVADLVGRDDIKAAWDGLDMGRKRAVVRALVDVEILPQKPGRQPGGSYFDPKSVRVRPAGG